MRKVIAALLVVALSAVGGFAQDKKPKLGVGDAAPPLTKVTAWLNGTEPKTFEKDKVYILEFWATWCVPCINAMPHLTELYKAHGAQGLVVIGMTNKDDNGNNKESVTKFVEQNKGEKLGYPVAYSDGEENYNAYMEAAGQNGIPCSFVVGKDGKIAFIGHPMFLDEVLPKVLDGTWTKANADQLDEREKELSKVYEEKAEAVMLDKFTAFAKKYPERVKMDDARQLNLGLLFANKKWDEAKAAAEECIAISEKKKKAMPAVFALGFAYPSVNPDKKHVDVAVKAFETAIKFDEKNVGLLVGGVRVYTTAGDSAKADAYGKKAIEAAPDANTRKQVEKTIEDMKKGK